MSEKNAKITMSKRTLVDELVERWKNHMFMKPFLERTNDRNNAAGDRDWLLLLQADRPKAVSSRR